jgi:hypothetical protein
VLLFWKVLWSTSTSLPVTVTQLPELDVSCTRLRVILTWCEPAGTLNPPPCLRRNPSTVR